MGRHIIKNICKSTQLKFNITSTSDACYGLQIAKLALWHDIQSKKKQEREIKKNILKIPIFRVLSNKEKYSLSTRALKNNTFFVTIFSYSG